MKKIKRGPLGDFKKIRNNRFNEIFEVSQCRKMFKKGTLWDFLRSIVLQIIETNEGETLWWNQNKVALYRKISV